MILQVKYVDTTSYLAEAQALFLQCDLSLHFTIIFLHSKPTLTVEVVMTFLCMSIQTVMSGISLLLAVTYCTFSSKIFSQFHHQGLLPYRDNTKHCNFLNHMNAINWKTATEMTTSDSSDISCTLHQVYFLHIQSIIERNCRSGTSLECTVYTESIEKWDYHRHTVYANTVPVTTSLTVTRLRNQPGESPALLCQICTLNSRPRFSAILHSTTNR